MGNTADYQRVRNSSLGAELYEDEARTLAGIMGVRQLKDGELLISEGGSEHTLFILASGKLAVINTTDGKESIVYTMIEGECAGTRAFVDRTPRKATLRAVGNATVYTLTPDAFESLLDTHPRIVYKVMRALFRVTHTNLMRMNLESRELANYISKTHGRY
ncbi:MAG: cyclic nucleotide-binding domain-containing protein [Pseudomonadota bacterium]